MERLENGYELDRPKLASELYDLEALSQEAWQLIQNRREIIHDHWDREPQVNARASLFEELTAKGHLSHIESEEPIAEANERTLRRLVNGWSDLLPEWEQERRFLEIVEEIINHQVAADVMAGFLPPDTMVGTISNYPVGVDSKEARDIGYRELNYKGMSRTTDFENGVRTTEQVSRSNSNDGSAERFLGSWGFVVGRGANRTLASQIITSKRHFPDGVIDIQRALDNFAGPNIIYGEDRTQPDLNVPSYEDLRHVSFEREDQTECYIQQLADFEKQLNVKYQAGEMDYDEKLRQIARKRKMIVDEICVLQPAYAKDARGEATVPLFEQASLAMAAGDDAAGIAYVEMALAVADPGAGVVCGGDGLQAAKETPVDARAIYLGAKLERKNWKWKKGLCIVKECPTRPGKVDVGPCSVCKKCQVIFDKGDDPRRTYRAKSFLEWLFQAA